MGVGRQTRKRRAEAFRGRARAHASSRKEGGFRGIEAREEEGEGEERGRSKGLKSGREEGRRREGVRGLRQGREQMEVKLKFC